jgi:hypothetical protein
MGFVENELGELTFHDLDLARLGPLVGVGAVISSVGVRRTSPHPVKSGGISYLMADLAFLALSGLFFIVAALVLKAVERL